jgi:peptide/nickel transport system ATP-binding protein
MNTIRGRQIAYIPQGSGNGLNPLYTVGHQMCEMIRKHQRCSRKEALARAVDLLESFGLENGQQLCKQYPFQLSGGMRQRVLIAMGIAAGAQLVFADEPTKGLDRRRITMVEDAFHRLGKRTLLCVTHDLRFAKEVSSRIIVMYASQQIENGSSEDFFTKPLHPYSQAMLDALPENGLHTNMGFAPPREDEDAQTACRFYARCPYRSERCQTAPPLIPVGERKVRCWQYAP